MGPFRPSLAGSEASKLEGNIGPGLPAVEVEAARAAIEAVRDGVRSGALRVAHDISDGGLAASLAECAIASDVGCEVSLDPLPAAAPEATLFGECAGCFIVAGDRERIEELTGEGVDVVMLGQAGGRSLRAGDVEVEVGEARAAWMSLAAVLDSV